MFLQGDIIYRIVNLHYLITIIQSLQWCLSWSRIRLQCRRKWKWKWSRSVMSDSLRPHGLLCPWDFPGKNTGMGCYFLLQGIFPTQGLKPGLPHCRQTLYCLSHQEPGFNSWVRKIPWRRKWQPTPVFLPGKSHGWRNLVGYSPWGHKELDTTERLHFTSNFESGEC